MKTLAYVPLLTYPQTTSATAVNAVFTTAAKLGASIDVNVFRVALPHAVSAFGTAMLGVPDLAQRAEADSAYHAMELAVGVKNIANSQGLDLRLETLHTTPPRILGRAVMEARYRDIAVLPWAEDDTGLQELAEAIIWGSGRPALIVPSAATARQFRHVAIAWDGSRVAARAVADARSLLARATRVTVLTISDHRRIEHSSDRLAESLSHRGLDVRTHIISAGDRPVAVALQETCQDLRATLLVMGGYGHSRLRDFFVGGATQGVLATLSLPVLISH